MPKIYYGNRLKYVSMDVSCPVSNFILFFLGCEAHKIGNTSSFHETPNTSLGTVQATPSKAQPSPTVHTKEALGKAFVWQDRCGW